MLRIDGIDSMVVTPFNKCFLCFLGIHLSDAFILHEILRLVNKKTECICFLRNYSLTFLSHMEILK